MKLRRFSLSTRKIFEHVLSGEDHELAAYGFVNVFIWRCLYDIFWSDEGGRFCVFFKDKAGCFMPLPPLGGNDEAVLAACFRFMEESSRNPALARIESIEAKDVVFFQRCGFSVYEKSKDFIVRRQDIASLKGAKLKHRRNLFNYFEKHSRAVFRDYRPRDRRALEALFRRWKSGRAARHKDPFYLGMLDDSQKAFRELLGCAARSGIVAKVALIDGEAAAFTSGAVISKDIFCVNFEIVDHAHKGLSQYVFTQFARTLSQDEINIMDDSGLESLKKTKMLLGPARLAPSFTAVRKGFSS